MSVGQLRVSVTTGRYGIWAKRSKNKLLSPKVAPERRKNRIISWEYTWFNRLFRIFLECLSKNYHLIDRLIRHRLVYYIIFHHVWLSLDTWHRASKWQDVAAAPKALLVGWWSPSDHGLGDVLKPPTRCFLPKKTAVFLVSPWNKSTIENLVTWVMPSKFVSEE